MELKWSSCIDQIAVSCYDITKKLMKKGEKKPSKMEEKKEINEIRCSGEDGIRMCGDVRWIGST